MTLKQLSHLIPIIACLFIFGCGVKVGTVAPEGMVLIPAGEFLMGSDDVDASGNEGPVHTVYVDAFYIDKYEVTNAQYKQFIDANPQWQKDRIDRTLHDGTYLALWNGNDYPPKRASHPVVYVSWYAAIAYAEWAGKRLPTEAEWEKAARGGLTGKKYPWGDDLDSSKANYNHNAKDITPVGSYPPNGYGLYDMAGNVWEWCLDAYSDDFYARSPTKIRSVVLTALIGLWITLQISKRIAWCGVVRGSLILRRCPSPFAAGIPQPTRTTPSDFVVCVP